jgi:AcrR family transcriptional regulator
VNAVIIQSSNLCSINSLKGALKMNKRKPVAVLGPRKAPKQERSRQTYQVILNGAVAVIRRDGLKKLSTNKVADESGVSIGSLYQYFPSKGAIIAALIDQAFEREYAGVTEALAQSAQHGGAKAAARAFFSRYYRLSDEELELRRILIGAVPTVERSQIALEFHTRLAEHVIEYFVTHFGLESRDRQIETFILQYISKGITLSSVDADIETYAGSVLVEELSDILLKVLRVPEEKW